MTANPRCPETGTFTTKKALVPGKQQAKRKTPRPWPEQEIASMRQLAQDGYSVPDIARMIGRSAGSVSGKLAALGWRTFGQSGRYQPPLPRMPSVQSVERPQGEYDRPIRCGEWPADAPLFEDDPRAPAWEPRWKAPPVLDWSAVGSSAAMCVDGRAARAQGLRAR